MDTSRLVREMRAFPRRSLDRRLGGRHDFRALFEASPVALIAILPDAPRFSIAAATDAYLRATMTVRDGPNGILGRGLFEVFPPPDPPSDHAASGEHRLRESLMHCIATGAPDAMPLQRFNIRGRDGAWEERWWSPVNNPVVDQRSGRVTHIIHRVEDVTVLQQSIRRTVQAEHATALAQEANAVKTRFLAAMSHELRTPLNAIAGYVDLLALGVQGPINAAQQDMLDRLRRAEQHLLSLINQVLSYAKIEAGRMQFDNKRLVMQGILRDVEAFVAPLAREKDIALSVDCSAPEADSVLTTFADEEKTRQVMINLVSNAIKFTNRGGHVTVSCEPDGDERVVVRIADSGVGIAPSDLERIFEPFVQVGKSDGNNGTGLGLPISRELARGMGGDVTVESRVGVGSTFTLMLPRRDRGAGAAAAAGEEAGVRAPPPATAA